MHYIFDTGLGLSLSVMPNVDFVVGEARLVMRDLLFSNAQSELLLSSVVRRQQFPLNDNFSNFNQTS